MIAKIKQISYCVISVLLVITLLSLGLFTHKGSDEPDYILSGDGLQWVTATGCYKSFEPEANTVHFTNISGKNTNITIPSSVGTYNTVRVRLNKALTDKANVRLYYPDPETGKITKDSYLTGKRITGNTVHFFLPTTVSEAKVTLRVNESIAITGIDFYQIDGRDVSLSCNFVALGALVGMLAVLAVTEKKYGYFGWILGAVKGALTYVGELRTGKKWRLWLHLCNLGLTALFLLLVAVFLMLNVFTTHSILLIFCLSIPTVGLQLADRIASGRGAEPAKLFLVIALLVGVMMSYTLPVTTHVAWDDEIHFRSAYTLATFGGDGEISFAQWRIFKHDFVRALYPSDPSGFLKTIVQADSYSIPYELPSVNLYTAISYLPSALLIGLLRLIGTDLVKTIALGHLFNLLVYAVIVYRGIRKLKSGATVFSAVCLLPCALYLGCVFSCDFWLTAWLVYAFAYVISELQQPDKPFRAVDMAKILLAVFIGCSAKALYCVMLLPLLFLGKQKFESPTHAKRFRWLVVLTVIAIAAILVLPGIFIYDMYTDSRGGSDVNATEQILFILSHPFKYARILIKHLGEYCSLSNFTAYSSIYGYLNGYKGNPYAFFGTFSALILLYSIITDRREDDCYDTRELQRFRWLSFATCFIQVVLIATSMYIGFSAVGAEEINGCQYRYLFPLLPLFCYFLAPKGVRLKSDPRIHTALTFCALTVNLLVGYLFAYIFKFLV